MAFGYYCTLTIDASKCGSADSTNFPVLVSLTSADLKTVANGGKVQNASGYDVGFYSDIGLTTKLNWETEQYTAASGAVIYWVQVPTVSHTVNTVFYIAFGDTAIVTDQSNASGTWDSNYKMVQHFRDGTTLSVADSTSNANNGTSTTNVSAMSNGKIDGAVLMNLNPGLAFGTSATLETQDITIETWLALQFSGNQAIVSKCNDITAHGWEMRIMSSSNHVAWAFHDGSGIEGWYEGAVGTVPVTPGVWSSGAVWHHVVLTWTSGTAKYYIDGALTDTVVTHAGTINYSSDTLRIGNQPGDSNFTGAVDEARISNVVRTADYVTTAYNSQSSPSTFLALGSTIAVAAATSVDQYYPGTEIPLSAWRRNFRADAILSFQQGISAIAPVVTLNTFLPTDTPLRRKLPSLYWLSSTNAFVPSPAVVIPGVSYLVMDIAPQRYLRWNAALYGHEMDKNPYPVPTLTTSGNRKATVITLYQKNASMTPINPFAYIVRVVKYKASADPNTGQESAIQPQWNQ